MNSFAAKADGGSRSRGTSWIVLITLVAILANLSPARAQSGPDPRNPYLTTMKPWAWIAWRLGGRCPWDRGGRFAAPLGDINNDGIDDFVVRIVDCTAPDPSNHLVPRFLYLFLGSPEERGLPVLHDSLRLSELYSRLQYLAHGDFDNDGNIDIVTHVRVEGDFPGWSGVGRIAVWWGQSGGHFSVEDTTHLSNGSEGWSIVRAPTTSVDFERDGADDLMVFCAGDYRNGQRTDSSAKLLLFHGGTGRRWGRAGVTNRADWSWFDPPLPFDPRLDAIDQDCDGELDLAITLQFPNLPGIVTVLYGKQGRGFDTTDFESIATTGGGLGHHQFDNNFGDFTGDGIPDLICNGGNGGLEGNDFAIYAGQPGQRLTEMYSGGFRRRSPERPFETPWARLIGPRLFSDFFASTGLFEVQVLGDVNEDGYDDFLSVTTYGGIFYSGGPDMDSLFDAVMPVYGYPARLGNIDGSTHATIATVDEEEGRLYLYHTDPKISSLSGLRRDLPHPRDQHCNNAAAVLQIRGAQAQNATPAIQDGETLCLEPSARCSRAELYDVDGRRVTSAQVTVTTDNCIRITTGTSGLYLLQTFDRDGVRTSRQVLFVIRR